MKWHQARQGLLAENVANADSPGYRARDLKQASFADLVQRERPAAVLQTARTNPQHIAAAPLSHPGGGFAVEEDNRWETTPSGNAVSLEDEMMKVTANQMDYQAAASLYSRSLAMLRIALGQNGA